MQQLDFAEALAARLTLNEAGQYVLVRIARMLAPAGDQVAEIVEEFRDRCLTALLYFRRQHRLKRAKDCQRPAAQRAALRMRNCEQVTNHLDRDGRGKILDQIDLATRLHAVEEPVD